MSATNVSPTPNMSHIVSDEYREAVANKGMALYEAKLKLLLEPAHNGEYIVLHVDNGDYALGRTLSQASRDMRARHGVDGRLLSFKIGPEPDSDGLVARILLSQTYEKTVK